MVVVVSSTDSGGGGGGVFGLGVWKVGKQCGGRRRCE